MTAFTASSGSPPLDTLFRALLAAPRGPLPTALVAQLCEASITATTDRLQELVELGLVERTMSLWECHPPMREGVDERHGNTLTLHWAQKCRWPTVTCEPDWVHEAIRDAPAPTPGGIDTVIDHYWRLIVDGPQPMVDAVALRLEWAVRWLADRGRPDAAVHLCAALSQRGNTARLLARDLLTTVLTWRGLTDSARVDAYLCRAEIDLHTHRYGGFKDAFQAVKNAEQLDCPAPMMQAIDLIAECDMRSLVFHRAIRWWGQYRDHASQPDIVAQSSVPLKAAEYKLTTAIAQGLGEARLPEHADRMCREERRRATRTGAAARAWHEEFRADLKRLFAALNNSTHLPPLAHDPAGGLDTLARLDPLQAAWNHLQRAHHSPAPTVASTHRATARFLARRAQAWDERTHTNRLAKDDDMRRPPPRPTMIVTGYPALDHPSPSWDRAQSDVLHYLQDTHPRLRSMLEFVAAHPRAWIQRETARRVDTDAEALLATLTTQGLLRQRGRQWHIRSPHLHDALRTLLQPWTSAIAHADLFHDDTPHPHHTNTAANSTDDFNDPLT